MTSALNRLKLLGDRADQLTRWQADAELQERARAPCDAERKERERTGIQTNLDAHIAAALDEHDRVYTEAVGQFVGKIRAQLREEFEAAIVKLRGEFGVVGDKLREELRDALDRLTVVDQERREREHALDYPTPSWLYWERNGRRSILQYCHRRGLMVLRDTPRTNSLDSLRGMEASRIKTAYEVVAAEVGIAWRGRRYDRGAPDKADLPNQAINHAVTALEACVAIAVQPTATLPPLGFLHEQSAKSFALDICDLYRTVVTVPIAFRCVKKFCAAGTEPLDREVRRAVSRHVRETAFVDTVIDDIKEILA